MGLADPKGHMPRPPGSLVPRSLQRLCSPRPQRPLQARPPTHSHRTQFMRLSHQQGPCFFSEPDARCPRRHPHQGVSGVPQPGSRCPPLPGPPPPDDVASGHPEPALHQGGGGAQHEGVGAGNAPVVQSWGETRRKSLNPATGSGSRKTQPDAGTAEAGAGGHRGALCAVGTNLCGA